jgi:hypothetical protein
MATLRRYCIVNDAEWEVWVEGYRGHWWVKCPCHLGPIGYYRSKPDAVRAARLHRRRRRQAGSSAGGGR